MQDQGTAGEGGSQLRLVPSNSADIAWAAGLFEGEGCWNTYGRKNSAKRSTSARLTMTDRDVVERFAAIIGFGTIVARKVRPNEKPAWEWYTQKRANVHAMIEAFWPYLGDRRRARAKELLALGPALPMEERTHCPQGHPYTPENVATETVSVRGRTYVKRRCKICRTEQSRERARKRLGITPDRYRVAD